MITIICTNFGNSTIYIKPGRQSERKTGVQKNLGTSGQRFSLEFLPLTCLFIGANRKYPYKLAIFKELIQGGVMHDGLCLTFLLF